MRYMIVARAGGGGGGGGLIMPGGGNFNNNRGGNQQSGPAPRLIIPGGPGRGQTAPGQRGAPGGGGLVELPDTIQTESTGPAPTFNRYRPPSGFMEGRMQMEDMGLDQETMLNVLQTQGAPWHEMGRMIPLLNLKGFDSKLIEDITGISALIQSRWLIAGEVFTSIMRSGEVDEDLLDYFERAEDGAQMLFEIRYVEGQARAAAARLIYERRLDVRMCTILARTMKEYERGRDGAEFFSEHPADILAMRFWRDACETKELRDKRAFVEKGLEFAVTEMARETLKSAISENQRAAEERTWAEGFTSEVTFLRLTNDELGFRPVPVMGMLGKVLSREVLNAPSAVQDGVFGLFRPSGNEQWVALPSWRPLEMSQRPVGIMVEDCSAVPSLLYTGTVKTEVEARKIRSGVGLVICDRVTGSARADGFYVVDQGGKAALMYGRDVQEQGLNLVAEVLFVCRQPAVESPATSSDSLGNLSFD